MLAIHGVKALRDIPAEHIAQQFGANRSIDELLSMPEYCHLNEAQIRKVIVDEKKAASQRNNKHCLKSIYNILPEDILERMRKRADEQERHDKR